MPPDPRETPLELLKYAAPERVSEIVALITTHSIQAVELSDKQGFALSALSLSGTGNILHTSKDFKLIWMLAISLWKELECYSTMLESLVSHEKAFVYARFTAAFSDQSVFEANLDAEIRRIVSLLREPTIGDTQWPTGVREIKRGGSPLEQATYDLAEMARAIFLFHEIRHITLNHSGANRLPSAAEELECDRFARDFVLTKISEYKGPTEKSLDERRAFREMALVVAACILFELSGPDTTEVLQKYPPRADRFRTLVVLPQLPPSSYYWHFVCSLMLGLLRRQGKMPASVPARDLFDLAPKLRRMIS